MRLPALRMAPSLLSADFAALADDVAAIERAGAEVLHLDVMDGHFVPNISFGIPVIDSLRGRTSLFFDAHLMIQEPIRYAEAFAKAGCDLITFHIEVTTAIAGLAGVEQPPKGPGYAKSTVDAKALVDHIHGLGVAAGVSINPGTPVEAIGDVLADVDLVLVMSVWPGFGGQKFIAGVLKKVSAIRSQLKPHQRLEIDGGIDPETVSAAASAGADTFVAGSAVFGQADPPAAMNRILDIARKTARVGT